MRLDGRLPGLLLLVVLLVLPRPALADKPIIVGDGTAASCTEAALANALAVAASVGGGRTQFHCGDAPATITVATTLVIPNNTTINGGGTITLLGTNRLATVFSVAGNTTVALKGLIFSNACQPFCFLGAVKNEGTITVDNTTFSDIVAEGGFSPPGGAGGAFINFGTAIVNNSVFLRILGFENAGAILNVGTLTVNNSSFSQNDTDCCGAAILNLGTATVNNSTFVDSFLVGGLGGAIYNAGTLTVKNCSFSDTFGTAAGGGIYSFGTLAVQNSTFSHTTAHLGAGGGGIYIAGGSASVRNSEFFENEAATVGGAIANYGTLELVNSTVSDNKAFRITFPLGGGFNGQGGGLFNAGTLTVVNSRLSGNAADDQGGGIFNLGTLILNKSIIADNTAIVGGGVYNCIEGQIADDIISSPCHGTLTLQRTTVTENTPDNIFP